MLERTVGCLQSGNLQRYLLVPKELKSRRMLHSAFWNHGALDLQLSSLWPELLPKIPVAEEDDGRFGSPNNGSSRAPFLDFLYPWGALGSTRQPSSWAPDRSESRMLRTGVSRLGQRLYTSISNANRSTLWSSEKSIEPAHIQEITQREGRANIPIPTSTENLSNFLFASHELSALLGERNRQAYDEAWKLYELSGVNSNPKVLSRLWSYLSESIEQVDIDRSNTIFGRFREQAGPGDYVELITSLLSFNRQSQAFEVCEDATKTFEIPLGSDILLANLLRSSQWETAHLVFRKYRAFLASHHQLSYNIWTTFEKQEDLPDISIRLCQYTRSLASNPTTDTNDFIAFTGKVLTKSLLVLAKAQDPDQRKALELLKYFRLLQADTPARSELVLQTLISSNHSRLAIRCYRQYRSSLTPRISHFVLHKMARIFMMNRSALGMQQILDDWLRYHGYTAPGACQMAMNMFASIGDPATVRSLFTQYLKTLDAKGLTLESPDAFVPLLHSHAICGQLSEVLQVWTEMTEQYALKPNVKSWNILINAYVKVKDVDGAQKSFSSLVESGLEPDSYSYGTLMGLSIACEDYESVFELYQTAKTKGVLMTRPMMNCVVLAHLREDNLVAAEKLCEAALTITGESPIRMWNYLLNAYGLQGNLTEVNRVLQTMKDVGLAYDEYTYAALMQALAICRTPDEAYKLLKDVMPKAGIPVRNYHYAIVMGGYIGNREIHKVWQVHNRMILNGSKDTSSTRLMLLKAAAAHDQRIIDSGSESEQSNLADHYFQEAYGSMNSEEIAGPLRKGQGSLPLDIAAQATYASFYIYVLGTQHAFEEVKKAYDAYLQSVPQKRRSELPIRLLNSLMRSNLNEGNHEGVKQCWDLALERAKSDGRSIRLGPNSLHTGSSTVNEQQTQVLKSHRFALMGALKVYMTSLARQEKINSARHILSDLEREGFQIDGPNWNLFIQLLVDARVYQLPFEICEDHLINNWRGWQGQNYRSIGKRRLLRSERNQTELPEYKRPEVQTLITLAEIYVRIRNAATESADAAKLRDYLNDKCAQTVRVIENLTLRTLENSERFSKYG